MPEKVAFGASLVPDALAQQARSVHSSFAQSPLQQSLASMGSSIQSTVAGTVAKVAQLKPGQQPNNSANATSSAGANQASAAV
eukprot:6204708-Pyramimonas_sp.AAC.1